MEGEIDAGVGERHRRHNLAEARRMPGDRGIDIVEGAFAHHEGLCRAALFRRTAIIAHAPLEAVFREPVLHRDRGEHRSGPEQIVAAAMAVAAILERTRLGDAGLLRKARQCIIFAKDRDHRAVFARLADHRGRNARDIARDSKALPL